MTVTAKNDSVTYKSARGDNDTVRPAEMVVAVNADGTAIGSAPGTGASSLGKAEDAVHTSGDVGVMALGVATDGSTALSAAGDYSVVGTDTAGNLRNVGSVASGATDSGNPVKVGGIYNSTPPTFTNGQRGDLQLGSRGALLIGSQAIASGGASFLNIAAGQATTTVKSGAGTLYAIVLNSAATATNTTTIYDNTAASGTVIGRPAVTTATVPTTLTYGGDVGLAFGTGLTIITATANGGDMTIVYK